MRGDEALAGIVRAAPARLIGELEAATPFMAARVAEWMRHLAGGHDPATYFMHPSAFPSLLLPWWLDASINGKPARDFHADLVDSTISGYYYIRLLDNVMDEHGRRETSLLPAAGFFHARFHGIYLRHFPAGHPFWALFARIWYRCAEATIRDAALRDVDAGTFRDVVTQKVSAAKIPLAAICFRYDRLDLLERWCRLCDALGGWHQMWNDVFGWSQDLDAGLRTYFVSEGARRRQRGESMAAWVAREGFEWGMATLETWMTEAQALTAGLDSPALASYLDARRAALAAKRAEVEPGLHALACLAASAPLPSRPPAPARGD